VIPPLRKSFNERFRPEAHRHLLHSLDACARTRVGLRIAETPIFLPKAMLETMASIGAELTHTLLADKHYLQASTNTVPEDVRITGETPHPHFVAADFGLAQDAGGHLQPTLVEMQAFPSLFALQPVLAELYRTAYDLDPSLNFFLNGNTEASFQKKFAQTILHNHDPENVVLLEIDPEHQKTSADFNLTADRLNIRILNITDVEPASGAAGSRLCYREGKRLIPIHRIYNRVVPQQLSSEIAQKKIHLHFNPRSPFNVEWAGHPGWYYRISKFSLPYLNHPAVPPAVFLHHWFAGKDRYRLPEDRNQWVLKPLFHYGGTGIRFAPSDEDLNAIPIPQRPSYLLQQRVDFARTIQTPHGPTQPEIRILYLWPDKGRLEPILALVRLGRGPMMGAAHTQDQPWSGISTAFYSN
jgi:hypothetical protein